MQPLISSSLIKNKANKAVNADAFFVRVYGWRYV